MTDDHSHHSVNNGHHFHSGMEHNHGMVDWADEKVSMVTGTGDNVGSIGVGPLSATFSSQPNGDNFIFTDAVPFCGASMLHEGASSSPYAHTSHMDSMHGSKMSMTMYMDGFHSTLFSRSASSLPCLNLFCSHWTLDSKGKFLLAMVGAFFMGFATECLAAYVRRRNARKIRRKLRGKSREGRSQQAAYEAAQLPMDTALHLLQIMVGYLDMLVVMTYSIELFFSIALGFTSSFAYHISKSRWAENSTQCKNDIDPENNVESIALRAEALSATASASIPCCDFLAQDTEEDVGILETLNDTGPTETSNDEICSPLLHGGNDESTSHPAIVKRR